MKMIRTMRLAAVAGVCLMHASLAVAAGKTVYVSPGGNSTPPYTNWVTAATNIQDGLNQLAGWQTPADVCLVTNGRYQIASTLTIPVNGVELRSVNGPAVTIIDGGDAVRCVQLSAYQAVNGFTLTRGRHASEGGGAYLNGAGSLITRCILSSNVAPVAAAAYLVGDGIIRNSIMLANSNGAVFCHWSGKVENCLVLSNHTSVASGGAVYLNYGGNVLNTISYYNYGAAARPNWHLAGTANADMFQFCNTTPGIGSATCFTTVPDFQNLASGNYRFYPGSAWINSGTNLSWMGTAQDLDGNARLYGSPDIGPYELTPGALLCSFTGSPVSGGEPLAVTLTASVSGTNQTSLYYRWDLDNDGNVDAEGSGLASLSTNFAAGSWSVALSVSNAAGEVSSRARANYINVSPGTLYVVPSGTPEFPYGSWATAATNIQDALDAAADNTLILVSNGIFGVTAPVNITKSLTVRGMGADATAIDGGGVTRCVTIANAGARLESVTVRNGYAQLGAGVYVNLGGTLSNCTISGNTSTTNGAGVYLYNGGLLTGCTIISNTAGSAANGGGVYSSGSGSIVTNCTIGWNTAGVEGGGYVGDGGSYLCWSTIVSNTAPNGSGGGLRCMGSAATHDINHCLVTGNSSKYLGGGMYAAYGAASTIIRDCLFTGNTALQQGGALSTHTANLDMDNCTIVGNTSADAGGMALYYNAHSVRNSIIYGNTGGANPNWYIMGDATLDISTTCTTPTPTYGTNNITSDPQFKNAAAGNYTLARGSPCIDFGDTQGWMSTSVDLAGNPRLQNNRVDLGAYESAIPRATVIMMQ